jgi:FkbM family methyltransferase
VLSWPGGFFIESGGHDGKFQSNTLALEKFFGWRGLLVEPAISNIAKIHANRNRSIAIHAGLVALGEDGAKLSDPGGGPMGKIAIGSGNVKGRALSSLLDDLNVTEVDFWSLDVEGYEVEVLKGMDFRRLRPKLIVVEVWGYNRNEVFSLMTRFGYDLVVGYDVEKGISGFPQGLQHRDFLWKDSLWQHALPKIVRPRKRSDKKTPDGEFIYGVIMQVACPANSSAPPGADSVLDCICEDGMQREVTEKETMCKVCDTTKICRGGVVTQCERGATNVHFRCVCLAGSYCPGLQANGSCSVLEGMPCRACPHDHWCADNALSPVAPTTR